MKDFYADEVAREMLGMPKRKVCRLDIREKVLVAVRSLEEIEDAEHDLPRNIYKRIESAINNLKATMNMYFDNPRIKEIEDE